MEDRMRLYLIRRIECKIAEGKTRQEIIEQLQAMDSRRAIERLLDSLTGLKIV